MHFQTTLCIFGRPFVKQFALCYPTAVYPVMSVCLSVTFVYCGQTVGFGWIKMKLGTEVGLVPGQCQMGTQLTRIRSTAPIIVGPCLLWPNGWMDQDATWYEGRPRSRPHCVRKGPSFPLPKEAQQPFPLRPMSLTTLQTVL